jgi:DNA topoisomerase-1
MSDAQLEEQMLRLTNNHGELFTASGGECCFWGFLKVYLEGHDDDEEEGGCFLQWKKVKNFK